MPCRAGPVEGYGNGFEKLFLESLKKDERLAN